MRAVPVEVHEGGLGGWNVDIGADHKRRQVDRGVLEHEVPLPRNSEAMAIEGEEVSSSKSLRMADLVFFSGAKGGRKIGHVAIYVNNGIFIHQANPGEGVRMESIDIDYYRKRYKLARRIIED